MAIILFIGFSGFLLIADNSILMQIPGLSRFVTDGMDRGYLWDYGIMLAQDKPIWGHGYGISQTLNKLTNGTGGMAFHNSYLTVAIETGFVGLMLVIVSTLSVSLSEMKQFLKNKHNDSAVLLMLIINMLLCFYGGSAMTSVGSTEGFFFWGLMMYAIVRQTYCRIENNR